jgi:hypothetical protein
MLAFLFPSASSKDDFPYKELLQSLLSDAILQKLIESVTTPHINNLAHESSSLNHKKPENPTLSNISQG